MRNPRGAVICVIIGGVLGMFIFGPIAAGETLRSAFVRRHFQQFERFALGGVSAKSYEQLAGSKFDLIINATSAGLRESHVHDVIITKEAPNYRIE
jgi:hypothetical protein